MTKQKFINFLDAVVEWSLYTLLFAVTFSISIVEIASSVMIAAWIIKSISTRDIASADSIAARVLLVFFLWNILSCVNSSFFMESFRGVFKYAQYGMVFIVMATGNWKKTQVKRFVYFSIGAVVLVTSSGLFQYFTGEDFIRGRSLIAQDHLRRISSSFVHPNDFGAYLMVMASVLISLILSKKNTLKTIALYSVPLGLSIVCLVLTGSRGAWVSFAAAFLVVGMLKAKRTAAVFAAILVVLFVVMPHSAKERIYDLKDTESGTTWERLKIWEGTINMIKEHPVLGFGVNTYSRHFPDHKPEDYPDDRYAHNCYLQMGAEIGIIGALLFIAFLVTVLVFSLKGILSMPDGRRRNLAGGLFAGVTGFSINSAFDTHLYSVTLAVFFWMLLGFCFSMSRSLPEEKS